MMEHARFMSRLRSNTWRLIACSKIQRSPKKPKITTTITMAPTIQIILFIALLHFKVHVGGADYSAPP
jgi:hypothetical protein